jgi:hypothetical protein
VLAVFIIIIIIIIIIIKTDFQEMGWERKGLDLSGPG